MGLPVVNKVLMDCDKVNGSVCSVEGFNGSVNKDVVSCKQPFGNLHEQHGAVGEGVHEAGQKPAFSGKKIMVRHRIGLSS